jgi:hypothetical protein
MTHPGYGVGGTQCGRCVGQGQGRDCADVSSILWRFEGDLLTTRPRLGPRRAPIRGQGLRQVGPGLQQSHDQVACEVGQV